MREQVYSPVTMVEPAPGFTSRVMARIQERERRAAQKRAIVGASLLLAAGLAPLVIAGIGIANLLTWLASDPNLLISGLVALAPLIDLLATVLDALWLGAWTAVTFASGQMLVYALAVLALTLLWVRVTSRALQLASQTIDAGGSG